MPSLCKGPLCAAAVQAGGDLEHAGWWQEHDALLASAWAEYGRGDPSVYTWGPHALHEALRGLSGGDVDRLYALAEQACG